MKIAVAADQGMVTEHFGHCEGFMIFEIEGKEIIKEEMTPNPGHRPGFLPVFLHEKGVEIIISGGMGGGAVDLFNEKGIRVIVGAKGEAKEVVEKYLSGDLEYSGSICREHNHD